MRKTQALSLVALEISDLLGLYKLKAPPNTGSKFCEIAAKNMMAFFEHNLGMRPPYVGQEFANAITTVYMGGDCYQWEENVEKDDKVMAKVRERREVAAM